MCLVHLLREFLHMLLANLRCVEKIYTQDTRVGAKPLLLVRFSLMLAHEAKFIRHMEGIYQRNICQVCLINLLLVWATFIQTETSDEHASVEESRNGTVIHQKLRQIKSGDKTLKVFARVPKVYD